MYSTVPDVSPNIPQLDGESPGKLTVVIAFAQFLGHAPFVDNTTHRFALPLDRIESALTQAAVPGFWGSVSIGLHLVKLQPGGIYEVQLIVERKTTTMPSNTKDQQLLIADQRREDVKERLNAIADRLSIVLPIAELHASFKDGHITGPIQFVERSAHALATT